MEISQIAATIFAWKRCSIPLYHHFCCSGSCLGRGGQLLSRVTAKGRECHQIWNLCWTPVQVNEYKLNRWKHEPLQQKPSVYWGSCCSICNFMCNIVDYYFSFCPLPFGLCTDLKQLLVFVKFKICIVLDYWIWVQVNEYKLNRWKHEPLQQKWW
jgi:hypothetical protein